MLQKYVRKCKDIYFILQNKYLCIYEDTFGVKILWDDCALRQSVRYFHWLHFLDFFLENCVGILIIAHLHTYFESDFGGCNSKQIWSVFLNLDRLWIINYDLLAWWWCDLTWIYICIKVVKFLDDRDPHSMNKMGNFIC